MELIQFSRAKNPFSMQSVICKNLEEASKHNASSIFIYICFGAAIPNKRSASANTSATHEQYSKRVES